MTLQVSAATEVLNPFEWMPSFGESSVRMLFEGRQLIIEIAYQADEDEPAIVKRDLKFSGVCAFYQSLFPGAKGVVDISFGSKWPIGSLVEFQESDVAKAWQEFLSRGAPIRHFLIQFTAENLQVDVLAEAFELGEPVAS